MTTGNCFEVSAELLLTNEDTREGVYKLVHGLPFGRGSANRGKRYWHSWIEVTQRFKHEMLPRPIEITTVIDKSNGLDITMTREVYYRIGELDEDHVWRYSMSEARDNLLEYDHYGPWVDGWEKLGL